jgi:putative hydrolase of the HAD superfamily
MRHSEQVTSMRTLWCRHTRADMGGRHRCYLLAMRALGVRPKDTWMVGDNLEREIAAPQRLGIYTIWHDTFGEGLPGDSAIKPDRTICALHEFLDGNE